METKTKSKIYELFDGVEYIEPNKQYVGVIADLYSIDCGNPDEDTGPEPEHFRIELLSTDCGIPAVPSDMLISASDCGIPHHPAEVFELLLSSDCGQPQHPPTPSPFVNHCIVDCGAPAPSE